MAKCIDVSWRRIALSLVLGMTASVVVKPESSVSLPGLRGAISGVVVVDAATEPTLQVGNTTVAPGDVVTIVATGFASDKVTVRWDSTLLSDGLSVANHLTYMFTVPETAAPGFHQVTFFDLATAQVVGTNFTVVSASGATSTPSSTPMNTTTSTFTALPTSTATATTVATATPTSLSSQETAVLVGTPSSFLPGSVILLTASGFQAGELITFYWRGSILWTGIVGASGSSLLEVRVSSQAVPGPRFVEARGASGDDATTTLNVVAPGNVTATPTPMASPSSVASPTARATATARPSATTVPLATATPTSGCAITSDAQQAEAQLLQLLNNHRAAAGVAPLRLDAGLSAISRAHSCDMYLHQQLSHMGSDGSSPFQRMAAGGYGMPPYHTEGENIGDAYGQPASQAVTAIDNAMMSEPLQAGNHHWNIVNSSYTTVGVGIVYLGNQTWITEDFAG